MSQEMLAEIASEITVLVEMQNDTERRLTEIERKLDRLLGFQRRALIEQQQKGS